MCTENICFICYHYLKKKKESKQKKKEKSISTGFPLGCHFSRGRNCDKLSNSTKPKLVHRSLFNRRHGSSIKCSHCVFHVEKETNMS